MRVLTLSWEYPPIVEGGLGRHVHGLSEALAAQGVEVHVVSRGPGEVEEECAGVVVHRVPKAPFPLDLDAFLCWVEELNDGLGALALELAGRLSFDLVHSHDWLVADAARALVRATGRPWIVTVHATEHGRHQGRVQCHPQSVIHQSEREMVSDADHLITCSHFMRGHVAEVFDIDRRGISALRNGIEIRDLTPVTEDLLALRARFARPEQRLVLLAGRLVHEKGFHVALDALAPVIRARGDVRFVVAGAGPAEAELRHQSTRLGIDHAGSFPGWVGDEALRALYRTADLCLVPSLYEPFGIVALEAMAAGCACLVADTGGLRELIPEADSASLRFPAGDAGALRRLVEQTLDDDALRAHLSTRARAHARTFDWARVARDTRAIYARQLAGDTLSGSAAPSAPPSR